jgi:hypothetical protein
LDDRVGIHPIQYIADDALPTKVRDRALDGRGSVD